MVFDAGKMYVFAGEGRDLMVLLKFARNGYRANSHDAIAMIPPDPETLSPWVRAREMFEDFVNDVRGGYTGIWVSPRSNTSFAFANTCTCSPVKGSEFRV